jgi:hypothetical protein
MKISQLDLDEAVAIGAFILRLCLTCLADLPLPVVVFGSIATWFVIRYSTCLGTVLRMTHSVLQMDINFEGRVRSHLERPCLADGSLKDQVNSAC